MMKNLIHIEDIRKRRDEFRKKQAEGDPDSGPEDRDLDELILALEAADLCREWLMDIRDRMLDRARERKPDEPA
jgi:hypothetical protein